MKRRYDLSLRDIFMIELSDIFGTLGVVGLLLFFTPLTTIKFLEQTKWVLLLISVLFGIIPLRKILKEDKELNKKQINQKNVENKNNQENADNKKSAKKTSKKVKKVKKKAKKGTKK